MPTVLACARTDQQPDPVAAEPGDLADQPGAQPCQPAAVDRRHAPGTLLGIFVAYGFVNPLANRV
eukprot:gene347-498_t